MARSAPSASFRRPVAIFDVSYADRESQRAIKSVAIAVPRSLRWMPSVSATNPLAVAMTSQSWRNVYRLTALASISAGRSL